MGGVRSSPTPQITCTQPTTSSARAIFCSAPGIHGPGRIRLYWRKDVKSRLVGVYLKLLYSPGGPVATGPFCVLGSAPFSELDPRLPTEAIAECRMFTGSPWGTAKRLSSYCGRSGRKSRRPSRSAASSIPRMIRTRSSLDENVTRENMCPADLQIHVAATDRRARFVGIEAYVEAGGTIPAAFITGLRSDLPGQRARWSVPSGCRSSTITFRPCSSA